MRHSSYRSGVVSSTPVFVVATCSPAYLLTVLSVVQTASTHLQSVNDQKSVATLNWLFLPFLTFVVALLGVLVKF